MNFKFIKPLKPSTKNFTKFITFEIETRTIDNQMVPYCICIFDGKLKYSFYLTDYKSIEAMIIAAIKVFFIKYKMSIKGKTVEKYKYNQYLIFAHNSSKFDMIFIFKYLAKYAIKNGYNIDIIKRNNDFINISISFGKEFQINFRDSYLLLKSSLMKLAKSFNVIDKGIFPYEFVNNPQTSLDYSGKVPEFKYFSNITSNDYNNYSKTFNSKWRLKTETIKYCIKDCIVLHQILKKFSTELFSELGVTLKYSPTTSSLALRSFLNKFINKNKSGVEIPIIMGEVHDFIQRSYTGGHVDVYKCHGHNLYLYDENSMYPAQMKELMTCGNPTYFEIPENNPFLLDTMGTLPCLLIT